MRVSRIAVLMTILFALALVPLRVGYTSDPPKAEVADQQLIASYHGSESDETTSNDDLTGGIKEQIPPKYLSRYRQWKQEFLSTEAGRTQWYSYQRNPNFTLIITITRNNAEGATTGRYRWNKAGQLVSATITLGMRLDKGYPTPVYFPVISSLEATDPINRIDGNILAATKLAHEFGHVNRTVKADGAVYQLQSQLMTQYTRIFINNGRNPGDPRLVELARRIGGTPVQVWEDREYWGEVNAMMFLRDKVTSDSFRCAIFSKIRHSLDLYAKDYETRFLEIAKISHTRKTCGWE